MEQKTLYDLLKRILLLEEGQVVLYSALASKAPDEETTYGLKRLAAIEGEHVNHIETKIAKLFPEENGTLSTIKNTMKEASLKFFGSTINVTEGITGLITLMQAGAAAETKAIADYRQMLAQIREPELRDMMWHHLIDEELHYLWLEKRVQQMKVLQT